MKDENIDNSRSLYYGLFSRFFIFTTNHERYIELVRLIDILKNNPLDDSTKEAFENLSKIIKIDSNIPLMNEFDSIFHSPESVTVRTSASFYDEGVESGKKRVVMKSFLAKTKIRRDEKKFSECEDHIGFIFTVLSELCRLKAEGQKEYENTIHCIFEQVLNEFVDEFSKGIYEHEKADIFKNVIVLLKAFVEFERIYLSVSKPSVKQVVSKEEAKVDAISEEEKARRERNRALRATGPKKEVKVETEGFERG